MKAWEESEEGKRDWGVEDSMEAWQGTGAGNVPQMCPHHPSRECAEWTRTPFTQTHTNMHKFQQLSQSHWKDRITRATLEMMDTVDINCMEFLKVNLTWKLGCSTFFDIFYSKTTGNISHYLFSFQKVKTKVVTCDFKLWRGSEWWK